jgi:predicted nucleic acid-binding protein
MSEVVLDASIAAKWIFWEAGSDIAQTLLDEQYLFYVPDIFYVEMDTIIAMKFRKRELNSGEAYVKRDQVQRLALEKWPHLSLADVAFDISVTLTVTIHDAIYLALAVEKETVMWTADDRLVRGIRKPFLYDHVINPLHKK